MSEKKNVPRLRFPGFTEPWEQRKLGDVFEEYSEKKHEELPPLTIIQGKGTIPRNESDRNILYDKSGLKNYKLVNKGDFILHLRSFEGGLEVANSQGIVSPAYHIFHGENTDTNFYYPFFRSKFFINILLKPHVYGIRDGKSIDVDGMKEIFIPYPKYEEQKILGSYFEELERLITLHQRKLEHTKNLKKSMLQKMFPKKGQLYPEVRFPEFTDAWEQRKLESICDVFTDGDWIEAKDQSESGVRLIQTGNVGITQYLDKEKNKKWISEDTFERLKCKEIFEDDILISRLPKPAGRACIMPDLGTKMITAVDCTIARTSKEYDSKYLVQYLSTPAYFKVVDSFLGGGTRQRISRGNLAEINISLPVSLDEQIKIGKYFAQLDNLITLHQRELEHLKLLKKGMLQQMFI